VIVDRPFAPRTCARSTLCAILLSLACDPGPRAPVLDIPDRPPDAPGGAAIARDLRGLDLEVRERRILAELARGNVPGWLRRLERVEMEDVVNGIEHRVTFWVTPDYLAVGSDSDFVLTPLSARTAQRIADLAASSLPTPRMVDAIWSAAEFRVDPIRLAIDEFRGTVEYFERHDNMVKAQRRLYHARPGIFAAGHKLDVVLTPTLSAHPGQVALYGWHRADGRPIQNLYIGADSPVVFSRGVRLVHRSILVDGVRRDLPDVLSDPALAPILSRGGAIAAPRYPR
jgi:hypothetical protein